MRHRKKGRYFGRNSSHRHAMFKKHDGFIVEA